jgi:hypothetical protein
MVKVEMRFRNAQGHEWDESFSIVDRISNLYEYCMRFGVVHMVMKDVYDG